MKRWFWALIVVLAAGQRASACDCASAPSAVVLSQNDVVLAVPLVVETPLLVETPVIVEQRVIVRQRAVEPRRGRPVRRFFGRLLRRR